MPGTAFWKGVGEGKAVDGKKLRGEAPPLSLALRA